MLILIAGISGNIGHHAANHALALKHTVRGLSRNPSSLPPALTPQLESFITSTNYYDIAALDAAVRNVDAIICAYAGESELHLDAQLLLLRAAERAGVKRFLAAGWNYDWRKIQFSVDAPIYDAAIAFQAHAEITSSIRTLHIFSGMLAGTFFGKGFGPEFEGGVFGWEEGLDGAKNRVIDIWGTGDEKWYFTTEEDAGAWGVEVVTAPEAEEGGFVSVCSWVATLNEVVETYNRLKDTKIVVRHKGSVEELEELAVKRRDAGGRRNFLDWLRLWFNLFCTMGTWNLTDLQNDRFNHRPCTLEEFIKDHPGV